MEEIKNNAIEKTEEISSSSPNSDVKKVGEPKKKNAKKRKVKQSVRQQKSEAKLKRKDEKQKRKQELKKIKLQKKEERKKRKKLLKNESKEDRRKRLALERNKRLELKRERILDKKAKRIEKAEERKQMREMKERERKERRKNNKGLGGWLAAVISLGCAVLILGGLLTYTFFAPIENNMIVNSNEAKNFYDLVGYVDNMDVNLSKLIVSNDSEEQQKLLAEVRVESSLASSSISSLALQDEDKYYTTKFINQVGDFSKYLNNKLIENKPLTSEDYKTLNDMYSVNKQLKETLSNLASKIDNNFDFRSIYEGKKDNLVIKEFDKLESNSVDYPHMIYDGAFSENYNENLEVKALKGLTKISKMEGENLVKKYFSAYNLNEITLEGETKSKNIECYNFTAKTSDGTRMDIQISKLGGKLIMFNHFKDCQKTNYDIIKCQEIAENFLNHIGLTNMKAVWTNESNNLITFNYASVVDGVICYSDLVKVNVCQERGEVSGIESITYYTNHVKRESQVAKISLNEAEKKVNSEIEIKSKRLAIIPLKTSGETLAYEFMGLKNGETYYIYISALTGHEVDIFKVVKTTEGTLLL